MKKLTVLLLVFALLISFTGCFRAVYTCYSCSVLYDENGDAVQIWVYTCISADNQILANEGLIYEIRQDADGSSFFEINSIHEHDKKMPIPEDLTILVNETKNESEFSANKTFINCLRPAEQGENAYRETQIVNLYYLDTEARNPVLVVTDMVDGVVRSNIINSLSGLNGECYFLLSNGQGEYVRAVFDYENPEAILTSLPTYSLIVEPFYFFLLNTVFEGDKPVQAHASDGKTYDVVLDDAGKTYISIKTVTDESIFIEYEINTTEQEIVTNPWADAILLPADIIKK